MAALKSSSSGVSNCTALAPRPMLMAETCGPLRPSRLYLINDFHKYLILNNSDSLNFDQHAGPRKVRDRDQRARGKFSMLENLAANFNERIAMARIVDEHGHGHHVGQRATATAQCFIDQCKYAARLRVE